MTLRLSGRLICATVDEDRIVHDHLPAHIEATRSEAGCLSFVVLRDTEPFIWTVEEVFTDRSAFEAHQTRTAASEWGHVTAGIFRDYTITED